jgi:hypothetical protein
MFFTLIAHHGDEITDPIALEWIVAEFSQVIRSFCQNRLGLWPIFCLDSIASSTYFPRF